MCYSRVDFSQELLLIMFRVAQNAKPFGGEGTGTESSCSFFFSLFYLGGYLFHVKRTYSLRRD